MGATRGSIALHLIYHGAIPFDLVTQPFPGIKYKGKLDPTDPPHQTSTLRTRP